MRPLLQRGWALLLLPLSIAPFLMLGPRIAESHRNFERMHKSAPYSAPVVLPSALELASWKPVAPYRGAVPVLTYHGIRPENDGYSVTRAQFARQMEMLDRAGFHTISIEQFARFRQGMPANLPSRPILITFDDGRLDSYRGAHRVLQQHGFKATMFVITGHTERSDPFYLNWRELHRMSRSGHWDVQPHAAEGHRRVAIDRAGNPGEFYAYRRYTDSEGFETYAAWQERVTRDLFDARDAMVAQGFEPVAFAVPYGNLGQNGTNDPRIVPYLRSLLATQFGVVLLQDARGYAGRSGDARRFEVGSKTTANALYGWLAAHDPAAAKPKPAAKRKPAAAKSKRHRKPRRQRGR